MTISLPSRRLVSQNDSAMIQSARVPRSKFSGSWTRKTAFDAGYLVPILVEEILPGDHMSYSVTAYVRLSTPLFPMFDNQRVDTFFFFVPCRLVWDNWVKFMGEQTNPGDSIAYTIPVATGTVGGEAMGSIYDHMGIPVIDVLHPTGQINVNAMPLRAYNLIYNTWFRDQNLINSTTVSKGDGPDAAGSYNMLKRAKSHDYFTSALPWPQKFTAPTVPLAGLAPVLGIGWDPTGTTASGAPLVQVYETGNTFGVSPLTDYTDGHNMADAAAKMWVKSNVSGVPQVYANLAASTGVSINTLREAFLVQQLLERDARGGTRYTELIRSQFDVINPDFRLQRPEYIGGGQSPLNLTPIAQTAPTTGVPLGALGAAGTAAGTHRASYAATEHGYIIGLINVRSELSYQYGLQKLWSRQTRYEFYTPDLAGLGEQAILRQEIYCRGLTSDTTVFGYQERWHEYRTRQSEVTGIMRSTATGTLDAWHLAQAFASAPTLNATFIEDTPPMARILAAGSAADGQQYLASIMYQRTAVRPIPTFGTPVTLGRF